MTEVFRQYLKDAAEATKRYENPDFAPGSLDDLVALGTQITEATIQRRTLEDMADLPFEDIEKFYQQEEE